jgi:acetylornithine deacetylase
MMDETQTALEQQVLAAVDIDALARDVSALVQIPSITGDEGPVLERLGEIAVGCGLIAELREYDLDAVRTAPGYPGEVAPRDRLFGLTIRPPGSDNRERRLCVNGHVDVVAPGLRPWQLDPWSGAIDRDRVYGRGSVDMKGGIVAALHAIAAVKSLAAASPSEVVLQAVSSEEDGGMGTFADLERDHDFGAALIPEPTGLDVACAHGGSLQFEGIVYGRSAHAATRLEGLSAIDRYIPLHTAMQEIERVINSDVDHELMRQLELPYPINIGRIDAGEWPAQVPDRLRFAGRLGVPVGTSIESARASFEAVLIDALGDSGPPLELRWTGAFRPSVTPLDSPFVALVRKALSDELDRPARLSGVPWGADMQHFCAQRIPCVMLGTTGIERAHAVDEFVEVGELLTVARTIVRIVMRFLRS